MGVISELTGECVYPVRKLLARYRQRYERHIELTHRREINRKGEPVHPFYQCFHKKCMKPFIPPIVKRVFRGEGKREVYFSYRRNVKFCSRDCANATVHERHKEDAANGQPIIRKPIVINDDLRVFFLSLTPAEEIEMRQGGDFSRLDKLLCKLVRRGRRKRGKITITDTEKPSGTRDV